MNFRGRSHTSIASITNPPTSSFWRPVLVFANRNSGSYQGAKILEQCRQLLNPIQVCFVAITLHYTVIMYSGGTTGRPYAILWIMRILFSQPSQFSMLGSDSRWLSKQRESNIVHESSATNIPVLKKLGGFSVAFDLENFFDDLSGVISSFDVWLNYTSQLVELIFVA